MKLQPFLFPAVFLCALSFGACKRELSLPEPDPIPNQSPNIFDSLEVGQTIRYLFLWGEGYRSNGYNNFGYLDDTLQLKIVEQNAKGFKVEETLHYVGDVHPWLKHEKDSVFHYYLKVLDDTLFARPSYGPIINSRIFSYLTNQEGIPMADLPSPKIEILGWMTDLGYCECRRTGYAENYTLFGQTYPRLNVLVNNSPMAVDANGETYVHSKKYGIVRFSTYSWWTQSGVGWDLIP